MNPKAAAAKKELLKLEILNRRMQGQTGRAIAAALGVSTGYVSELLAAGLSEAQGNLREAATVMQATQLAWLDRGQSLVANRLFDEKLVVKEERPDGSVMELAEFEKLNKLSMTLIKFSERICKIGGLDAPEKVDLGQQKTINADTLAAWLVERKKLLANG